MRVVRAIGAAVTVTAGLVVMPSAAAAAPVGPELSVNTFTTGSQFDPAVAVADSGASVVVWTSIGQDGADGGIYAQRYDAAGEPDGTERQVNTHSTATQSAPAVAMDADGDFVVAWQSAGQDGSLWGVYAQRFRADGSPVGDELRVNTTTTREQVSPAVATDDDGDFVVVWASYGQDGSQYGVFGQRFAADGTPLGGEFQVNTYVNGNQNAPAVDMTGDGRFVVAWQSFTQNGGVGSDPYIRRYDADGVALGAPVRADTHTVNDQGLPGVALDDDGDITVVWRSIGQDGSMAGVYLQRYSWSGTPVGGETLVNTFTSRDQTAPTVDASASGEVVVAWASDGQDGSSFGIHAQRYDANGAADGGEEQVNTHTAGVQTAPAVAVDAGGGYVVAWQSAEQDGSGQGVYAQRFVVTEPEVCDGVDNDRDGVIDDGVTTTFYVDTDLDGYGSGVEVEACSQPAGHADRDGDADDDDATVHPDAPELCDGKDNDQDGVIDDGWPNADGDELVDCIDPDDDNDGIDDSRDPDVVSAIIMSLPSSAMAGGGAASAMVARLDAVERQIAAGRSPSVDQLAAMRAWLDGCDGSPSEEPDRNDKIVDCAAQHDVRAALDALIANLSG